MTIEDLVLMFVGGLIGYVLADYRAKVAADRHEAILRATHREELREVQIAARLDLAEARAELATRPATKPATRHESRHESGHGTGHGTGHQP